MKSFVILAILALASSLIGCDGRIYTAGDRLAGGHTYTCLSGPCVVTADYINGGGIVLQGTLVY
jgi:hypothetical protein